MKLAVFNHFKGIIFGNIAAIFANVVDKFSTTYTLIFVAIHIAKMIYQVDGENQGHTRFAVQGCKVVLYLIKEKVINYPYLTEVGVAKYLRVI